MNQSTNAGRDPQKGRHNYERLVQGRGYACAGVGEGGEGGWEG